jgi:hypothetical protein
MRNLLTLCLLLAFLPMAGCNIIGPAAVLASGPPKIDARHGLDKDRPTVIFVDDRASVLPRRSLRQTIAQATEAELLAQGVLTKVIDSRSMLAVASRDSAEQPSDIATLAKSVSAEIAIYISIDRFGITPDGQVVQPFADARVKVLDVTLPQPRVWPEDREGFSVQVLQPQGRSAPPSTPSAMMQTQDALATQLGRTTARLFFRHEARIKE